MIYILQEWIMNGTVTMSTTVTGVQAKSFKSAVSKVKKKLLKLPKSANVMVHKDDMWAFRFTTQGDFMLYSNLENKPLNQFPKISQALKMFKKSTARGNLIGRNE